MPRAIDGWKTCTQCGEHKLVSAFHKRSASPDGLQYDCKVCHAAYNKAHRQSVEGYPSTNYGSIYRAFEGFKICGKCKEPRPVSMFHKSPLTIDGLCHWCRDCYKVYHKVYYQTEEGKQVARRGNKRRRARKAGCLGSHTTTEFFALCEAYDFRCLRHGEQLPFEELTEDHIIPVGPGISDSIDNIQPLCGPCNSWKGRRTIDFRRRGRPE